jgi:hypothetical protein
MLLEQLEAPHNNISVVSLTLKVLQAFAMRLFGHISGFAKRRRHVWHTV